MHSGRPGVEQSRNVEFDLYVANLWHLGWLILGVTDPAKPNLLKFISGPEDTFTIQVQVAKDGL